MRHTRRRGTRIPVDKRSAPSHGNFNFERWDPVPVGSYPSGRSDLGVADLMGNGWEWTRTPFEPFPGFAPFSFIPDIPKISLTRSIM